MSPVRDKTLKMFTDLWTSRVSNRMKKILLLLCVLSLGFAPHVFAQGFVPLAPIPGLTEGGAADSSNLALFFNNLYKFLIGLAAALAVIEIIWGGLEISTKKDSVSKQSDGRERITQAIFGLILVLSPVLVFSIINPNILNLSLNLKPLILTVPKNESTATKIIGTGTMNVITGSGTTEIGTKDEISSCRNDGNCEDQKASCRKKTGLPPEVGCFTGSSFRPYDDYSSELQAYSCHTGKLVVKCVLTDFSI